MKRRKPLRRGKSPSRRKGLRRKAPIRSKGLPKKGKRRRLRSVSRSKRRVPAVGTELTTFALKHGCSVADFRTDLCWGPLDPHHVRPRGMGRARGDWVTLPDGQIVGNVVGACRGHHEWCEAHPAESRPLLIPVAEVIGKWAIAKGIAPVLYERRR